MSSSVSHMLTFPTHPLLFFFFPGRTLACIGIQEDFSSPSPHFQWLGDRYLVRGRIQEVECRSSNSAVRPLSTAIPLGFSNAICKQKLSSTGTKELRSWHGLGRGWIRDLQMALLTQINF